MGGKVVVKGRKKKKGRPSLADIRSRCQQSPQLLRSDIRSRRHRRHRVGDGYELEEEENEEEAKKREKKLKLVLRLPRSYQNKQESTCSKVVDQVGAGGTRFSQQISRDVAVAHPAAAAAAAAPPPDSRAAAGDASDTSSFGEYDDVHKPLKKRKLGDADCDDDTDHDCSDDDEDDDHDHDNNGSPYNGSTIVDSGFGEKGEKKSAISKPKDPAPGMVTDSAKTTPLPDIKLLEFLLDKLQKKDTYGVFADPVDPNELPDYHDVIENPMDFGTIRKKLTGAVYSTLEQLEKDVLLLCTNAMRYNAPETIYFKQAHSIQELARKKLENIRVDGKDIEMEFKSSQKARPNSVTKNPLKISPGRSAQEPVGSDFSSGATLAMAGDTYTWSNTGQARAVEKPVNMISFGDGSSFMDEIGSEKAEEVSAKGLPSKFGRKPFMFDENRRLTYKISNQLAGGSESLFSIFECENKQLISVGLHAEHAYTRSLARFTAALGPVAWRVASQRIKQALPAGLQFGPGWVAEYEPLPRPILLPGKQISREAAMRPVAQSKGGDTEETREVYQAKKNDGPSKARATRTLGLPMEGSSSGASPDRKPGFLGVPAGARSFSSNLFLQQNNSSAINVVNSDKNILGGSNSNSNFRSHIGSTLPSQSLNQVKVSLPESVGNMAMEVSLGQRKYHSEMPTSSLLEMASRNSSSHMPSRSGNCSLGKEDGAVVGRLTDGKITSNPDGIRVRIGASDYVSNQLACGNQLACASDYVSNQLARGNHEQGPINQVRLLKMLSGRVMPNQPKASSMPAVDSSTEPSSKRDDSSATAAAWSRMSMRNGELSLTENLGLHRMQSAASSLYNPAWELSKEASVPSLGFQSENKFGSQIFPQPGNVVVGKESQLQNRSMVFPLLAATDLSRAHMQSTWQGLGPQTDQRQRADNLPPDLNISFQLPGSPAQHSPGMLADSQQPDLALQL